MHPGKIKIIIVDDHQMIRETWRFLLERHEKLQVVAECASGTEAIDCAANHCPDVMLMDINMSPVNGFEATRKILKHQPNIKIIGVSVNDQPGYARNMLQLGGWNAANWDATHNAMPATCCSWVPKAMLPKTLLSRKWCRPYWRLCKAKLLSATK